MVRTMVWVVVGWLVAGCGGESASLDSSAPLPTTMNASSPSMAASGTPAQPAAASAAGVGAAGNGPAMPPARAMVSAAATAGAGATSAMSAVVPSAAAGSGAGAQAAGAAAAPPPPSAAPTDPLFPANGAVNVCADASLHLRFDAKPSLGTGKISVFEKGSSAPVASVDVAAGQSRVSPGGTQLTFTQPVFVVDNEVIVQLPAPLGFGKSYYVTVDSAAVHGTGGAPISGEKDWSFSTRSAAPANLNKLRVAVDGTGDFCSVQAALEAAASGATITVGQGNYHELIHVSGKSGVTLSGDDRKGTVILGVNNDRLNSGTAKRALISIEKSSDLIIERLTIKNTTPQDGSQAEALRLQGCDKCVVRNADIISLQDTLLWSGRIYAKDCYIAGNVDFVWGTGAVYFDQCEIKTVGRKGVVVQSRNDASAYGYVFVDSKISAEPGISGIILARIDVSVYPGSHVAYVGCEMGKHIAPEGWTITGGIAGSSLRFWEYQSKDEAGGLLDVSRRNASSQQISAEQAATMRDPSKVLGGWMPPQ